MKTWLRRLGLSFFVTLGFTASKLPAQAPLVPPSQYFDASPSAPLSSLLARPPQPQLPAANPRLNAQGYCCDSDLNWYGCGGLKAQVDFYFGSCRTFFGEPCLPNPPREFRNAYRP